MRDTVSTVSPMLRGEAVDFDGKEFSAHVPALRADAHSPREAVPIYIAGTGPRTQRAAGEIGDGLLTASISTPAFLRYARKNMEEGARRAGRDASALDLG